MLGFASLIVFSTLAPAPLPQESAEKRAISEPWICAQQREDGSWSAHLAPEGVRSFQPGVASDDLVVTSLVVLSFLGDGTTPTAGPHKQLVSKAALWLLEQQDEDSRLATYESETPLADHAIACLALCETAYLTGSPLYRPAAASAVRYLEDACLEGGGWSASGEADAELDLRTTLWASMALASARDAELIEAPELLPAAAWSARRAAAARDDLTPRERSFELATRVFAGDSTSSPEFARLATELLATTVTWQESGEGFDAESYYLRGLIAYQCGGELWKNWQKTMKQVQKDMGPKELPRLAVDPAMPAGSLAAYSYHVLALEMYFRYARVIGAR